MAVADKVVIFFSAYPRQSFAKGEILLHAEEAVPSVFYIVDGLVSQYDIAPNGSEVVVNVFKSGAFFPMSSAINETENHYFFEANQPTVVYAAPAAEAVRFVKDNPDVLFDLLGRVYRGVDGLLRRMAHLMGGGAKSRLTFELLNAAQRFGERQPGGGVLVELTETELARRSGLARETVNRTIQDLKVAQLIVMDRRGIVIPDVAKLESGLGTSL